MRIEVANTDEVRRVCALPRRTWSDAEAAELAAMLTVKYKTAYGRESLRPIQGVMVAEAADVGGLFAAVSVGKGKTLATFLAPAVLGAARPVLLVQANLLAKTKRDYAQWSYSFRVHPRIHFVTYEQLSRVSGANILEELNPDLIIADEAHRLKARERARVRRFLRYFEAHRGTKFIALSGSITRRSLRDYWHLLCLALPETAPVPYVYHQLEEWADALDPDVDERVRIAPGVLLDLSPAAEGPTELDKARDSYRRRLSETRGVVVTPTNEISTSLILIKRDIQAPQKVDDALLSLRTTWETPNGDELTQAIDVWRHARELACGFVYRWVPPPPAEWLEARKAWNKFVREILGRHVPTGIHTIKQAWDVTRAVLSGRGRAIVDSPLQVAREYVDHPLHLAWVAVRDLYNPAHHQVAEWLDDYLLQDAAAWLREGQGIAWVEHDAVGRRLSLLASVPYYGGGPDASTEILDAQGPIVASIKAHGTGKNLQAYARNLLLSCPPSADILEQLIGRTHREGQAADEVTVELYLHVQEIRDGLSKAFNEAKYIESSTGMPQKLLYADRTFEVT